MLSFEQMREQVSNYQMCFDEYYKKVYITKGSGQTSWLPITVKRAIQWVEAGIDDLDCRSKKKMLDLLNSWIK